MCPLIVTFHEIAIKHKSELKTQLVLLGTSTNNSVGSPRPLYFKLCEMIYLFKTFIMETCYEGFSFMRLVT